MRTKESQSRSLMMRSVLESAHDNGLEICLGYSSEDSWQCGSIEKGSWESGFKIHK